MAIMPIYFATDGGGSDTATPATLRVLLKKHTTKARAALEAGNLTQAIESMEHARKCRIPFTVEQRKLYCPLPTPGAGQSNVQDYLGMILTALRTLPQAFQFLPPVIKARFICMILGIMRQESKFDPKACYSDNTGVNACGLLQMQLATAQETVGRDSLGMPVTNEEQLKDPQTNITIGVHYLYYLLTNDVPSVTADNFFLNYSRALARYRGAETEEDNKGYQTNVSWYKEEYKNLYLPQIVQMVSRR